MGIMRTNV